MQPQDGLDPFGGEDLAFVWQSLDGLDDGEQIRPVLAGIEFSVFGGPMRIAGQSSR